MGEYILLAGLHFDDKGTHHPGAIVESPIDLVKRFGANHFGYAPGAEPAPDTQPRAPAAPPPVPRAVYVGLEMLTVRQLQDLAGAEGIDTQGARDKEELLRIILQAQGYAVSDDDE